MEEEGLRFHHGQPAGLLFTVHCKAQWPTTVEGAIVVDNGLYPYLAVDPIDQSVTVVYVVVNYNQIGAKKFERSEGTID
jgi:hypothetical protein